MNRFRMLTAGMLVAGVLAGSAAAAQGPRFGGQSGPGGRGGRGGPGGPGLPLAALNLTDSQQQQIRDIRERGRESAGEAQQRLQLAMQAQRSAVEAVPLNEHAIRAAVQDVAEAQTELALIEARLFNEVWNVLTPVQQEQAAKARAERQAQASERLKQRQERQPRQ